MSECTHNCDTCSASCGSKETNIAKLKLANSCKVKKIIGVSSGKGGVGKSFVTSIFIDMPPGTGDVPLTVYQSIPIDEVIIVTSPQDLVSMIVSKSINMAHKMDIKIFGVIENMSYVVCPSCSERIEIFGKSKIDEVVDDNDTIALAKLPMRVEYAKMVDEGMIEDIDMVELDDTVEKLAELIR